jgi:hypothetical protein
MEFLTATMNEPQSMESMAMFIAKVMHDAIGDFYSKHLSNDEREELDSIIRNAVYTALFASKNYSKSSAAKAFVTVNLANIPKGWEEPKPLESYQQLEELYKEKRVQGSTNNEVTSLTKSKDDLIETKKYKGFEIRVHQFPWEPTFFFTTAFAENGKAQVADILANSDEEYADAATALR